MWESQQRRLWTEHWASMHALHSGWRLAIGLFSIRNKTTKCPKLLRPHVMTTWHFGPGGGHICICFTFSIILPLICKSNMPSKEIKVVLFWLYFSLEYQEILFELYKHKHTHGIEFACYKGDIPWGTLNRTVDIPSHFRKKILVLSRCHLRCTWDRRGCWRKGCHLKMPLLFSGSGRPVVLVRTTRKFYYPVALSKLFYSSPPAVAQACHPKALEGGQQLEYSKLQECIRWLYFFLLGEKTEKKETHFTWQCEWISLNLSKAMFSPTKWFSQTE